MNDQPHGVGVDYFEIARYLWLVIAAVFTWIFKRHIDEDKQRADELAEVRESYATREDISVLHRKIDENHREVMRELLRG